MKDKDTSKEVFTRKQREQYPNSLNISFKENSNENEDNIVLLNKYLDSNIHTTLSERDPITDKIVYRYLKVISRLYPDKCEEFLNKLNIINIEILKPEELGPYCSAKSILDDYCRIKEYKIQLQEIGKFSFIDTIKIDGVDSDKAYGISTIIHELNHVFNKIQYVDSDETLNEIKFNEVPNYKKFYVIVAGFPLYLFDLENKRTMTYIVNDMFNEAITDIVAHSLIDESEFDDILVLYNSQSERIKGNMIHYGYGPFVCIANILKNILNIDYLDLYFNGFQNMALKTKFDKYFKKVAELIYNIYKTYNDFKQNKDITTISNDLDELFEELNKYFNILNNFLNKADKNKICLEGVESEITNLKNPKIWNNYFVPYTNYDKEEIYNLINSKLEIFNFKDISKGNNV